MVAINQDRSINIRGHLPALDGLRGLAIIMVLFHHIWPYTWNDPIYKLLSTAKQVGWLGVDLFFVLSGFLITGILLDTRNRQGYLKNFLARRSLRVFPLYFFFLFLAFAVVPRLLMLCGDADQAAVGFGNQQLLPWFATYFANLLPLVSDPVVQSHVNVVPPIGAADGIPDYLAVTWSLCVEEHFYLAWPLLLLFYPVHALRMPVVLVLVALACRAGAVGLLDHWQQITYMTTLCRMDGLAVGAAVAIYARSPRFSIRRWRYGVNAGVGVLLPVVLLWVALGKGRSDPWFAALGYTLSALAAAALLASVLGSHKNVACRVLEWRTLRWFGKYSYGLYLYHMLVLTICEALRPAATLPNGSVAHPENFQPFGGSIYIDAPVRLLLVTAVTCLVAWLSFQLLEKPFLELKRHFAGEPTPVWAEAS